MSSSDSRLTYNSAGGCRHINQIDDVFGSDAQQTTAADVTAAGAVPVGRGGERPFMHDASESLNSTNLRIKYDKGNSNFSHAACTVVANTLPAVWQAWCRKFNRCQVRNPSWVKPFRVG